MFLSLKKCSFYHPTQNWKNKIAEPQCLAEASAIIFIQFLTLSLLSTETEILASILPSRLSPFVDKIIGDHQCGFQHNRSTTDHMCCIHQILGEK
jgi:hypothetical protein